MAYSSETHIFFLQYSYTPFPCLYANYEINIIYQKCYQMMKSAHHYCYITASLM